MQNIVDFLSRRAWDFWLGLALLVGGATIAIYAREQGEHALRVFAVAMFLALAGVAGGFLVGFLFGIPRSFAGAGARKPPKPGEPVAPGTPAAGFNANTNLEELSDWLTKIIVGVGLVQLNSVPENLMSMADYLSGHSGVSENLPSAVVNLIVWYFGIISFLMGYLWTRLYITREFTNAERELRETAEMYEGMIHAFLYQPPPAGYEKAIETAQYYREHFSDTNDRVWTYLALAYGQKYSNLQGNDTDPAKVEVKKKALEAVQRAIQLNPAAKALLKAQWDKSAKPPEDDLKVFSEDDAFKAIFNT